MYLCPPPYFTQRCPEVLSRPINWWATVWRKSRLKFNENKKNELLRLILHRAVRVQYSLKSWGYIRTDRCAISGRIENIEHCFLACPRVVRVWNYFSALLSCLSDSTFVVSIPSVFYVWWSAFALVFLVQLFCSYHFILGLVSKEFRHVPQLS